MKEKNQVTRKWDVYQVVTDRIIEQLEQNNVPWRKPWTEAGFPQNLISKRHYRGVNVWLLLSLNYRQNYFLTFKQAQELGASVRKGEKSHMVVFTKWDLREDGKTGEMKKVSYLKYYHVFNISQCEGIPKEMIPERSIRNNNPIEACQDIIVSMPNLPEIRHDKQKAFYVPSGDYINMPLLESFSSSESYYGTLFHELIHSTGHFSRLNRSEIMDMNAFGSEPYSIEELTAEIGSCYLMSHAGILTSDITNTAAYIRAWLEKLRNDKRFIVFASAQAQRAVEFILDILPEKQVQKEKEVSHE